MGQVIALPKLTHYWDASTVDPRRRPLPLKLNGVAFGCGQSGMHLDRIMNTGALDYLWPWMRHGVENIKLKNSPQAHWLPEHVRMEILKGLLPASNPLITATECFVGHSADDESVHGFMICYPLVDPFVNLALTWFVWMGNIGPGASGYEAMLPQFEQLARDRGYRRWRWKSTRPGWERRAAQLGVKLVEREYERELF